MDGYPLSIDSDREMTFKEAAWHMLDDGVAPWQLHGPLEAILRAVGYYDALYGRELARIPAWDRALYACCTLGFSHN